MTMTETVKLRLLLERWWWWGCWLLRIKREIITISQCPFRNWNRRSRQRRIGNGMWHFLLQRPLSLSQSRSFTGMLDTEIYIYNWTIPNWVEELIFRVKFNFPSLAATPRLRRLRVQGQLVSFTMDNKGLVVPCCLNDNWEVLNPAMILEREDDGNGLLFIDRSGHPLPLTTSAPTMEVEVDEGDEWMNGKSSELNDGENKRIMSYLLRLAKI